ncbi:N-acetylmuramoyl-L-alanine amidase [Paenibacillus sp. EC2-1]|uniref:N-acetylmuramoyl-L-alanine amidase n=1 Tax=Paenibacillus sp. EC2-1 TaxID=3388665 RepID=UPI003BEEDF0F
MMKVWIDAGHGGKDPGKVDNGLKEKDIVLNISLNVKKRLESEYEGVQVMLTRSTDIFVELDERTKAANKAGADILVSIHCNGAGGAGGFESFRYTNPQTASVTLQNVLHTEIMTALKPFGVIDRKQKAANLHMVRESKMPAVLTENLFIDVATDAERLKRIEVINALIDGHVKGIAKYLGLKSKEGAKMENTERDINKVSPWAEVVWKDMSEKKYFDGTRPGAPITREEMAIVLSRVINSLSK